MPAPVAFFAFRRPWMTLQALYSLSRCPEAAQTGLHVFCDGPRNEAEAEDVRLVREVVRAHRWCGSVRIHESDRNRGLARSIIDGVGELCRTHGEVIVVEDDLRVSSGFLAYMNEGLARFRNEDRVMQISGHSFPAFPPEPRAVLLPAATTWGWATWQRAWSQFEEHPLDAPRLLRDPAQRRAFELDGAYPFAEMLERQLAGEIDSWGIRWWWTVHRRGGLGLFPLQTLVQNAGVGEGATHMRGGSPLLQAPYWTADGRVTGFPSRVEPDAWAFGRWKAYLARHRASGLRVQLARVLGDLWRRGTSRPG